jgi:hypothetical protein
MSEGNKKNNNEKKEEKKEEKKDNSNLVKLRVFEEDDYFEEFEQDNIDTLRKKDSIDFKQWQADWEDEEINDHFEEILKSELKL